MVQNNSMRLDHVSYVTSHDQLADTVQRLGSRLGTTFVDGGIHPRFGTHVTSPHHFLMESTSKSFAHSIIQQQNKHLGVKQFQRRLKKAADG
jgi:hypothetical protein